MPDAISASLPLTGSVALVTGSSRRIGRAIATALARAGADVAVHARSSRAEAEGTAAELRALGVRAIAVLGDVGVPAECERIVAETVAGLGALDILVNNASMRGKSTLDTTTYEEWRRVQAVTLDAAFLLCKAALPHLRASPAGRIVNIGGASAHMGASNHLHVIAAKSGLQGLTRAMAHDLGPDGITVNMVSPGLIEDPADDPEKAAFRRTIYRVDSLPLRRPGRPEEIGEAVAMIADPRSGYVTGQTIHVNGGVLMP
ncbi:SDR family NAD(P)-dependent oxidoreductase [Salinarimonas sp. NSM]|uniref:SDR family NAD(P)-dependent oxidoreductase n=1 Tax=Salinarimonas sp. NSM TaxID=3458003 RepID=UPI004036CC71